MRRNLVWDGAEQLRYEIREIVDFADKLKEMGRDIRWENIGDPIQKGETVAPWIKEIVSQAALDDKTYGYVATMGSLKTREFLAERCNTLGGAQISPSDILFFNGLGDGVARIFGYLRREARVLGPSPAYSTLSSAEAAHSGYAHLTYQLDWKKGWIPNLEDIENKVKYNDSIAGILLINPDNPTGAVYSEKILKGIVDIARRYDIFVLSDETYTNIVYPGVNTAKLSEVIGEVPGIALRSISKEFPWPGGRCGWAEVYNKDKDSNFETFIKTLIDAKRLEVCSTSLPQMVIPQVYSDPRFPQHLAERNRIYQQRAEEAAELLSGIPGVTVIPPKGAFYFTLLFEEGLLNQKQKLHIKEDSIREFIENSVEHLPADKRFVYYLLGAKGICVVPLTGFCTSLEGFRATLLEADDEKRRSTWIDLKSAIQEYLS